MSTIGEKLTEDPGSRGARSTTCAGEAAPDCGDETVPRRAPLGQRADTGEHADNRCEQVAKHPLVTLTRQRQVISHEPGQYRFYELVTAATSEEHTSERRREHGAYR